MLIKFDLKKSLGNSTSLRQLIDALPATPGESYLINYLDLKNNYRFFKKEDVINYIVLASYRDYRYSIAYNDYSLDWNMTNLSKKAIEQNKLIWHNNNRIFFRFEESKASTLRKRN